MRSRRGKFKSTSPGALSLRALRGRCAHGDRASAPGPAPGCPRAGPSLSSHFPLWNQHALVSRAVQTQFPTGAGGRNEEGVPGSRPLGRRALTCARK